MIIPRDFYKHRIFNITLISAFFFIQMVFGQGQYTIDWDRDGDYDQVIVTNNEVSISLSVCGQLMPPIPAMRTNSLILKSEFSKNAPYPELILTCSEGENIRIPVGYFDYSLSSRSRKIYQKPTERQENLIEFQKVYTSPSIPYGRMPIGCEDYDGDGTVEVFVNHSYTPYNGCGQLLAWRSIGDNNYEMFWQRDYSGIYWSKDSYVIGDYNSDGISEIMVFGVFGDSIPSMEGGFYLGFPDFLQPVGTDSFRVIESDAGDYMTVFVFRMDTCDINKDGSIDLIKCNRAIDNNLPYKTIITMDEYMGRLGGGISGEPEGFAYDSRDIFISGYPFTDVNVGDLDADGVDEIAMGIGGLYTGIENDPIYYFDYYPETDSFSLETIYMGFTFNPGFVEVQDANHNGKPEIWVAGSILLQWEPEIISSPVVFVTEKREDGYEVLSMKYNCFNFGSINGARVYEINNIVLCLVWQDIWTGSVPRDGQLTLFRFIGDSLQLIWQSPVEPSDPIWCADMGDPDQDNKIDIIYSCVGTSYTWSDYESVEVLSAYNNPSTPDKFEIGYPYPNPFNSTVRIPVELQNTGDITLRIYNILGEEIFNKQWKIKSHGEFEISWDGKSGRGVLQSSGIYFIKIEINSGGKYYHYYRKAVLIK